MHLLLLFRSKVGHQYFVFPILRKEFLLRTGAWSCCLLQEQGDYKCHIPYASKKLLDREKRYSIIEKE